MSSVSVEQESSRIGSQSRTTTGFGEEIVYFYDMVSGIASYELEMETEGLMYRKWKAIKGVVRR